MRRNLLSRGTAAVLGSLVAAGLVAASAPAASLAASAAPPAAAASGAASSAGPAPAASLPPAAGSGLAARLAGEGSITGTVRGGGATALEGICVTATGPSGTRLGMTRQDGRFLIPGLRPGGYSLRYRDCARPARYLPQWYGGSLTRAGSRSVLVGGSGLVPVAPVTLRPLTLSAGPLNLAEAPAGQAMLRLARSRFGGASGRRAGRTPVQGGRISGRVTDRRGHPLAGICVLAVQYRGPSYAQSRTGTRGYYTTAPLRPGRYAAVFFSACGNQGNWLSQVYKNTDNLAKPTLIAVRPGETTANINAALRPGGEISGTVTNAAGRKLSGICADPFAAGIGPQYQVIVPAVSRAGAYHVRGVPAGSYRMLFTPCNPRSGYAPVWWKNSATPRRARLIRVRDRQRVAGIGQVIPLGGKISGVVTGGTPAGPRLAGICVFALPSSPSGGVISPNDVTATRADGSYVLRGLPPGSYQVQFSPGCPGNGNYLQENYPSPVTVSYGTVRAGINGVLPRGARISGVVTDSRGRPIGGICVVVQGGPGNDYGNGTQTAASGTYAVGQLPAGSYTVTFSGGCGNPGSYAPQGYHGTNVNAPQPVAVAAAQQVSGIDATMQPGATISGRVTSASGRGLGGVCVIPTTPGAGGVPLAIGAIDVVPPSVFGFATAPTGGYRLTDLQPGQYELAFVACGAKGDLAARWYSGRRGLGRAAIISAAGRPTAGIDVTMRPGGAISGAVSPAAGRPVPGACVQVTDLDRGVQLPVNETFAARTYLLNGLPPGAYHVAFVPGCAGSSYATQWYSGRTTPAGAARVIVRAGRTTGGIDAALTSGGSVTGLVTSAATHAPLRGVCAFAQNVAQPLDFGFGVSNRQGRYVIGGLNSGRYSVGFISCENPELALRFRPSLVAVVAPRQTRGIGMAMARGGTIQGQVTAGSPATPGQALCVDAVSAGHGLAGQAITDAAGAYRIPGLAAGHYLVYIGDPGCPFGPYNTVPQWYRGSAGRAGATPVTVTNGAAAAGIDANLALDGSITGAVRGPGGAPLTGVCVTAVGTSRGATPVVAVTARGGYAVAGLRPGRYRVEFSSGCGAAGFATRWWRNAGSAAAATVIVVAAGATVTGISAVLPR